MNDSYRDPDDLVREKETTSYHDDDLEIQNDETPVQHGPRLAQRRRTDRRPPPRKRYDDES